MDQTLQERLDRIEQRMDTFDEKLEQRNAELLQASAQYAQHFRKLSREETELGLGILAAATGADERVCDQVQCG